MNLKRRDFINISAATAASHIIPGISKPLSKEAKPGNILANKSMPAANGVPPITVKEREARLSKAQRLLTEQKIRALLLDAGTTMEYFTGIRWWPSERPMVAIITAKGEPVYVCPAFEEDRLKELISIGKKTYVWQEDESAFRQIANALKDAGIVTGNIAMEERLRFFIFDGIRKQASHFNYVSGDGITIPCRLIKSPAEIALMQKANDITVEAIRAGISNLQEGITPDVFSSAVSATHEKLGAVHDFAGVSFGKASAFPHGSSQPQTLKKGDIVLMDCGCRVQGYSSDISRTIVFGADPTPRQLDIWKLEQQAQAAGFIAARPGNRCEDVDAAARKILINAGLGPGYKLPGLPHRTGHGIGMDGHEWGNMVKGNKQMLAPGMCFSIEPTISIPGEFGIRMEDCAYMTAEGAKWFSQPALSIGQPFAGV